MVKALGLGLVWLLGACLLVGAAEKATPAPTPKAKQSATVAKPDSVDEFFGRIDWSKPTVNFSLGYLFEGGGSLDTFLGDVKAIYGGSTGFTSAKGGLTFQVDVLWDMGLMPQSVGETDPGTLYAGLGLGFLQAAHADWKGYDPYYSWWATWGDYTCSYYVIPIELKAKYFFVTPGLFARAGLGMAVENVGYSFKNSEFNITDSDSKWRYYKPKVVGTGAGFIADLGFGYEREIYTSVALGGSLDGLFYVGKVSLLSINPKIWINYKF